MAMEDRSAATREIALAWHDHDFSTSSVRSCLDAREPRAAADARDASLGEKRQPRLHPSAPLQSFAEALLTVSERAVALHSLVHQRVPERATPSETAVTTEPGRDRRSDFCRSSVTKLLVAGPGETMRMAP
jgi:hypothetical protein